MASTTSFDDWFAMGNEPQGDEDVYELHYASNGEGFGTYTTRMEGDKMFITGPSGDTLALVSGAATTAFRRYLENYKDDELDWDSWIGYRRAIAKDD